MTHLRLEDVCFDLGQENLTHGVFVLSKLSPKRVKHRLAVFAIARFAVAAVAILAVGAARPSPIVLVSAVSLLLGLTWLRLFILFLAQGGRLRVLDPAAIEPESVEPS